MKSLAYAESWRQSIVCGLSKSGRRGVELFVLSMKRKDLKQQHQPLLILHMVWIFTVIDVYIR